MPSTTRTTGPARRVIAAATATALALTGAAAATVALTGPAAAEPATITAVDFTDGTTGTWTPSGGAALEVVPDPDDAGDNVLSITRAADYEGVQSPTGIFQPGTTYDFSMRARVAPAAGDETPPGSTDVRFVMKPAYTWIGNTTITSEWTTVAGSFTAAADADPATLQAYLGTADQDGPYTILVDDILVTSEDSPGPPAVQDLTPIHETTDFPVGVAIDARETTGPAGELTARHFNQLTAENHMKPEAWYDADGNFRRHADATALMDFAAANDLRVYGHVLAWHGQTPDWFFQDDAGNPLPADAGGQAILRERLRTHIFAVAENLAADYGPFGSPTNPLVAWDVVNEVVSDGGEHADGLRRSEWYRVLGEEFIDLAFRYADEAFNEAYAAPPSDTVAERPVTLFINDYNTEQSGKQDRYLALVERLLSRGVPLDGVGHQFHVNLSLPVGALGAALDRFADLPVTQAVTELDLTTGTPVTQAGLIEQAYYYRDAFRAFRERSAGMYSVTVWGLTDGRSWRADNGAPLLFDDAYQAKPAYYGVVDGELPAKLRTADVFAGDVPLDGAATSSLEWRKLPLHTFATTGGDAAFQLRWAPDHLTAYVSVDDATAGGGDALTLALGDATYTVARDGSGDAPAVASEREGGYDVVVHLPLDGAAEGGTADFDVRVSDGGGDAGSWNSPGALGTLRLIEELSYTEISAVRKAKDVPVIDGVADRAYAAATPVTTAKAIQGGSGAEATVRTLWSGSTLYVLAEVSDPEIDVTGSDPWVQDSVELYVDAGNAKNGGYRANDTQIRISAENTVSFGAGDEADQAARLTSAVRQVEGGYVVEAAIDLLSYGGPGTFHGVDFQVNDATGGTRTAIRNWADPTGAGYQSTAHWGVAQLIGDKAPKKPKK